MPFDHVGFVITDAIAIAIVSFAISISMAKLLAKKHEYDVDSNQASEINSQKQDSSFIQVVKLCCSILIECMFKEQS